MTSMLPILLTLSARVAGSRGVVSCCTGRTSGPFVHPPPEVLPLVTSDGLQLGLHDGLHSPTAATVRHASSLLIKGGPYRTRTCDPLRVMQVRYQLRQRPR